MTRHIALLATALLLAACGSTTLVDKARELGRAANGPAAEGIVELLAAECLRDPAQRRDLLAKIAAQAAAKAMTARPVAQDCDGDGQPDAL